MLPERSCDSNGLCGCASGSRKRIHKVNRGPVHRDPPPLDFAGGPRPGNLITHLRKLEEVGYVSSSKTVIKLVPQTTVALTNRGRAALDAYRQALRELLGGL